MGLAVAVPFYWLLIDTVSTPELIAGAVAVVLAALAYGAAHLEPSENAAIRLRWLPLVARELVKVPAGIVVACEQALSQTIRPTSPRGTLEVEPFEAGSDDDPHDVGRRALAEATRSFAPTTIVIGVDPDHDRVLIHRIGARR